MSRALPIRPFYFLALTLLAPLVVAQPSLDEKVHKQLEQSQVMEHLFHLTDATGPRVVGSPSLNAARIWLEGRLKDFGLHAIRREENLPMNVAPGTTWNPIGWSWSRLDVQQVTPWRTTLIAVPVLYSPGMRGMRSGEVTIAPLPPTEEEAVNAFIARYRGKLRGKFILLKDKESVIPRNLEPSYRIHSSSAMEDFKTLPPPSPASEPTAKPTTTDKRPAPSFQEILSLHSRIHRFLNEEGVLGMIGSARGEGGTLSVRPPATPPELVEAPPPTFDLAPEHFNRIIRLINHGTPVRLEADLRSEFHGRGTVNLMAEIPGTDKQDELIVVGAHLDSWHGGTGGTDNAAGVAVLLETARVIAASGIAPRRTIRFVFWDGHELGTVGSRSYAAVHLVDPATQEKKGEFAKTSCYFNLDYGAGRIRGVYLQGRIELKADFESWLKGIPGESLVASPRTTLGSDQATFERLGIPGISFIQDPLNYEVLTHHTTMDLPDYASADDLNHGVQVIAHLVMQAANSDHLLPKRTVR